MSFLKTMINSVARTFGRILAYALIGALIYFIASKFALAKDMYWVQILRNGSGVTDYSNVTEFSYTGTGSAFDIHYQLSTQANEQVYMNSSYLVKVFPNTVARREVNAWYKDTNGTWHQVQQYCFDNGTRKQSGIYEEFTENISCQFKTAVATTEFIIRYSYLDSNSDPFNFTILNVVQKSNAFSTQESEANSINANNDKNTNSILNGIDNMGDAINGVIENKSDEITNAINNQYNVCNDYDLTYGYNDRNNLNDGYLKNDGTIATQNDWYYTSQYFIVNANKTYNLTGGAITGSSHYYCLYDKDYNIVTCGSYTSSDLNIIPIKDGFLRFSLYLSNASRTGTLTGEYCYNALEKENEQNEEISLSLKNIASMLNDDSAPSESTITNTLNGINLPSDTPMTNMLMFPVLVFSFFGNSMSSSCSPVVLGTLYGHELALPCLNVANYLGLTLWNIIDLLAMFYMVYNIVHLLIGIFEDISELRSPFLRFFIKNRGAITND